MDDLSSLYDVISAPDDAAAKERASALQSVLRDRQLMAAAAQFSGIKQMQPWGQHEQANADDTFDKLAQAPGQRTQNLLHSQQAQKIGAELDADKDPRTSAVLRKTLGVLAPEFANDPSFANAPPQVLRQALDPSEKIFTARQSAAARRDAAATNAEYRKSMADARGTNKANQRFTGLGHELNSALASSRTGLGVANNVAARGARLLALLGQGKSIQELDKINPQWVHEASAGLAALITGGNQPAMETIRSMVPNGSGMDAAQILQWVTNEPTGAHQGAFLKKIVETINREDATARAQILKSQLTSIAAYPDLRDHPDRGELLQRAGVAEYLDPQGNPLPGVEEALRSGSMEGYRPGVAGGQDSPQDAQAKAWLQANPGHPAAAGVIARLKAEGKL